MFYGIKRPRNQKKTFRSPERAVHALGHLGRLRGRGRERAGVTADELHGRDLSLLDGRVEEEVDVAVVHGPHDVADRLVRLDRVCHRDRTLQERE